MKFCMDSALVALVIAGIGGALVESETAYPDFSLFSVGASINVVLQAVIYGAGWVVGAIGVSVGAPSGIVSKLLSCNLPSRRTGSRSLPGQERSGKSSNSPTGSLRRWLDKLHSLRRASGDRGLRVGGENVSRPAGAGSPRAPTEGT